MNKNELVKEMAKRSGLSAAQTTEVLKSFTDIIKEELDEGRQVVVYGFGTFIKQVRAARHGINPSTGEPMNLKAHYTPCFRPSPKLKEFIKQKEPNS